MKKIKPNKHYVHKKTGVILKILGFYWINKKIKKNNKMMFIKIKMVEYEQIKSQNMFSFKYPISYEEITINYTEYVDL